MGSWNATCNLSQLPICAGDEVRVLFLTKNPYSLDPGNELQLSDGCKNSNEGCYINDFWFPRTVPLKARYDDYGAVTDIDEKSISYSMFWEQLESDVVQIPLGENEYHDPPLTLSMIKERNWDKIWDVATEGRLRVSRHQKPSKYQIEVKEDVENAIKEASYVSMNILPCCPVMIREDVYTSFINMRCVEKMYDYDHTNENSKFEYFDLTPEYFLKELKKSCVPREYDEIFYSHLYTTLDNYNPPFTQGVKFYFISLIEKVKKGELSYDKEEVKSLLQDISEFQYVYSMMSRLRKTWHLGTGCGSQENDIAQRVVYYSMMAAITTKLHKKDILEQKKWDKSFKDPLKQLKKTK